MEYKKSMIIIILAIFLLSIAGVCASDVNDTVVDSGDTQITDESIQASENQENEIQGSDNDEVSLSEEDSSDDTDNIAISNDNNGRLEKTVTNHTFKAINYAIESDCTIYLEPGTYTGNSGVDVNQKSNVKIIGNSTILDAQGQTGIFAFWESSNITIQNIIFKNGNEFEGGAIDLNSCTDCSISNCTFINNHANDGDAIHVTTWSHNARISNCIFINNHADDDEGGAIYCYNSDNGRVNDCIFINNHANGNGGAIYWSGSENDRVNDCIFINNTDSKGYAISAFSCDLNADYNWFGNNATNYNDALPIDDNWVYCDYRLFLNAIANPDTLVGSDTSNITFKLYQYHSGEISDYDNTPFKNINLTITATNGNAAGIAKFDEPIQFTPTSDGTASVTATVENVAQTVEIPVKGDFDLLQDLVNNESLSVINLERNYVRNGFDTITDGVRINRSITINGNGYTIDAKGKSRIFYIEADNVVIENITFKNANFNGDGGALYFNGQGTVTDCNFADNFANYGGAINMVSGSVTNCNFTGNKATSGNGGAVYFDITGTVENCYFADNQAKHGGAIGFSEGDGAVTDCNFVNNTAFYDGGAIWFNCNGIVENCNFTDNTAESGGAIWFFGDGDVTGCSFVNNWGGIYYQDSDYYGTVTNCSFVNNWECDINMNWGNVTGCIFVNCSVIYETGDSYGAVHIRDEGHVINCSFVNCSVFAGEEGFGGAVSIDRGDVIKCSFVNCSVFAGEYGYGGAVYIDVWGTVENCSFVDCSVNASLKGFGGAVYFDEDGTVENCSFVDCSVNAGVEGYGGAVCISREGYVINCSFVDCYVVAGEKGYGGAVYFDEDGTVENCSFVDSSVNAGGDCNGGAVYFDDEGTVENCNFTGNNAATGSAIFFYSISDTKTVSNSIFLRNRVNAEDLEVVKNENTITIIFTGQNNLLNAIYSSDDGEVTFTNVTYWGVGEKTNTGSSPIKLSGSNKEAGQNITVSIVVDNVIILNKVYVTDEEGTVVLNISVDDNYLICVRHDEDSYYSESVKILTDTQHNVNVTSQTTHSRTVNLTAKSDIPQDIVQGKLIFILQNGTEINAVYAADGIWWAVHTFDDFTDYQVNASYIGLGNVSISNATISISRANSTVNIGDIVLDYGYSKNVTVTAEGATGITAMIDNASVSVINDFTIPISGLNVGTYNLTVTTIPDRDHYSVTKIVTITVNKLKTQLKAKAVTATYNVKKYLVITLKDAKGNPLSGVKVSVKIKKAKKYTTNKKGQIKINVAKLVPKKYTVKISFAGNAKYKPSSANVKVKVKKAKVKITAKKKSFKKAKKVKKYTITLKSGKKPIKKAKVTIKIKKKTFKAKTNTKGKATFKIKKLTKKGKHAAAVKFAGNKYYRAITKKVKITVKK